MPQNNRERWAFHCEVIKKLTEHCEPLTENLIARLRPKNSYESICLDRGAVLVRGKRSIDAVSGADSVSRHDPEVIGGVRV